MIFFIILMIELISPVFNPINGYGMDETAEMTAVLRSISIQKLKDIIRSESSNPDLSPSYSHHDWMTLQNKIDEIDQAMKQNRLSIRKRIETIIQLETRQGKLPLNAWTAAHKKTLKSHLKSEYRLLNKSLNLQEKTESFLKKSLTKKSCSIRPLELFKVFSENKTLTQLFSQDPASQVFRAQASLSTKNHSWHSLLPPLFAPQIPPTRPIAPAASLTYTNPLLSQRPRLETSHSLPPSPPLAATTLVIPFKAPRDSSARAIEPPHRGWIAESSLLGLSDRTRPTCYLNSTLQLLFQSQDFEHQIKTPTDIEADDRLQMVQLEQQRVSLQEQIKSQHSTIDLLSPEPNQREIAQLKKDIESNQQRIVQIEKLLKHLPKTRPQKMALAHLFTDLFRQYKENQELAQTLAIQTASLSPEQMKRIEAQGTLLRQKRLLPFVDAFFKLYENGNLQASAQNDPHEFLKILSNALLKTQPQEGLRQIKRHHLVEAYAQIPGGNDWVTHETESQTGMNTLQLVPQQRTPEGEVQSVQSLIDQLSKPEPVEFYNGPDQTPLKIRFPEGYRALQQARGLPSNIGFPGTSQTFFSAEKLPNTLIVGLTRQTYEEQLSASVSLPTRRAHKSRIPVSIFEGPLELNLIKAGNPEQSFPPHLMELMAIQAHHNGQSSSTQEGHYVTYTRSSEKDASGKWLWVLRNEADVTLVSEEQIQREEVNTGNVYNLQYQAIPRPVGGWMI